MLLCILSPPYRWPSLNLHYAKGYSTIIQGPGKYLTFHEGSMEGAYSSLCECGSPCQCPHCCGSLFRPTMLNQRWFCTPRGNWQCLKTLLIVKTGSLGDIGALWHLIEARDAVKHHTMHQTTFQNRLIQPKMPIVPMMRNPSLDQITELLWSACYHRRSPLIDHKHSGQCNMSYVLHILGAEKCFISFSSVW